MTIKELNRRGFVVGKQHILSSYGIVNYPEFGGDFVRVGIALYGMLSEKKHSENCGLDLRSVLTLKARVALVKVIDEGEAAGYGLAFKAERKTRVAVLTIGYADGYPRMLGCGVGSVLIHGKKVPIVGKVCMDQLTVDITEVPDVLQGEEAVLIGNLADEEVTACDLAELSGTIANEILSRLGSRLERIMI